MIKQSSFDRSAGVLMPISSLPSSYGIGSFDKEAYKFVDFLEESGQKYWQVLPLGPTSYGDSPYQSLSAFAGNPYFISIDTLILEGLLHESEINYADTNETKINYENLYNTRFELLKKAFRRFKKDIYYHFFCDNNKWLSDYALFMALKTKFNGIQWSAWPDEYKFRNKNAMKEISITLAEEIDFWKFCQFKFFQQWEQLKQYANYKNISIIGDIPIYISMDSSDTWSEPEVFYLDENLSPIEVAGVPPDAFSEIGQLWGNPLYKWEYQKLTDFKWWKNRMFYLSKMYDVIRFDHFCGLESYYAVPFGNKDAREGNWYKGPGIEFFKMINLDIKFILEDLGFLTGEVINLREQTGMPGMKILQFAFDSREESNYLPYSYDKNSVVYTGTHDNDTVIGWVKTAKKEDVEFAVKYLNNKDINEIHWDFIRTAYASVSDIAIIPIQDFLGLGSEARINIPSTLENNWCFRLEKDWLDDFLSQKIFELTKLYGR